MTYRPRRLKKAKTPLSKAALRYFMAPIGTCDDYYQAMAEIDEFGEGDKQCSLELYYLNLSWRELWQQHRSTIEAEWRKTIKTPEGLRAQREWACRSYSARLDYIFKLEIQRERERGG